MSNRYFRPNSKKAIRLAVAVKSITATVSASAYFTEKPTLAFIVLIVGALANELINFLSDKDDSNTKI